MKLARGIGAAELGRGEMGVAGRGPLDGESVAAIVVFLVLAALPAVIAGYPIYILPQYMLFGMLALSLALLWGQIGIVSFGQAAFFALGAYAMGLAMQQAALPVNGAYLGLLASIVLGGVLAGIIGYFLFSAGVRGAYFVIVTLALSIIVEQLAVSQSQITGGWNGMFIDRMSLTFGSLGEISLFEDAPIYYLVLVVVAAAFALLKGLSRAPFGKVLVASARTRIGSWPSACAPTCTRPGHSRSRARSPASPARSTARTPTSWRPRSPGCCSRPRSWSGSRSAGATPCSERCSPEFSYPRSRTISARSCPAIGSSRSGSCSCSWSCS
jgi:Branched-chain amino acid transport system / permease component